MPGDSTFSAETLHQARAAGASDLFVMVAAFDPEAAQVSHNHVQRKLRSAIDGTDNPVADIKRMGERSGDYVANLWDGDLAEALYHADATNKRLLLRMLNNDVLLAALAEDRGSMESAKRWLAPYVDRYGWPGESIDGVPDEYHAEQ